VDKRADIWAFGCVLYEMLTGRRLFDGEDMTEILASVVKEEPDLGAAPPAMRRLLRKCLEKDPKRRLRDIGDAWDLVEASENAAAATVAAKGARLPWAIAALAVLGAVAFAVLHFTEARPIAPAAKFELPWPGEASGATGGAHFFALSPDGQYMAMVVEDAVWVRPLDSTEATRLDRTEGATYPFWSPDSASIGFFATGQLKRIARTDGAVQVLCDAPEDRGGTWSPNGTIVFSDEFGDGLKRVSDGGGAPTTVATLAAPGTSDALRYPQFLPDGEHFLYLHLTGDATVGGVHAASLDGGPPVRLIEGQDNALYAPSTETGGYLLFRQQDTLMAQPFDATRLRIAGAAVPVAQGVSVGENTGLGAFSVSNAGSLAVWNGAEVPTQMVWMDRAGKRIADVGSEGSIDMFSLSRDERRLALALRTADGSEIEVWTMALPEGALSKFTFGPPPGWGYPLWSPDGSELAYATFDLAGLSEYEIRRKAANMSSAEVTIARRDITFYPWDWSPDGRFIVYTAGNELWMQPVEQGAKPVLLKKLTTEPQFAQVSPDGHWLAYAADDHGQTQVFVQPMPPTEAQWLISGNGGSMPRWRQDGRELFYRGGDGRLMAAALPDRHASTGDAGFEFGPPQALFGAIPVVGNLERFTYQPSANGQRFLVAIPVAGATPPITFVLNWERKITPAP
jgi:eukaryotic-like serine/threonine-protein kinase